MLVQHIRVEIELRRCVFDGAVCMPQQGEFWVPRTELARARFLLLSLARAACDAAAGGGGDSGGCCIGTCGEGNRTQDT